jgi:hypothetical protein
VIHVAVPKTVMGTDMSMVSVTEDRLSMLRRMRARLGEQIDTCGDSRSLCLLMARLQSVLSEIDEIGPVEVSAADEIARRRQERHGKGLPVSIEHAQGVGREHR